MKFDDTHLRGVLLNATSSYLPPLAVFLTSPLMARGLGVAGRGDVAGATAPALLATNLLTLGIPEALTYFVASARERYRETMVYGLLVLGAVGLVGAAVVAASADALSKGSPELTVAIRLCALIVPMVMLDVGLRAVASARGAWGLVSAERLISAVARFAGIGVLFVLGHMTVVSASLMIMIATALGILAYAPLIAQRSRGTRGARPPLMKFGIRVWIGSLSGILLSRLDQTIMIPLAGPVELGWYVTGVNVAEVALVLTSAISVFAFSVESGDPDSERLGTIARLTQFLTTALCVTLIPVAYFGIPIVFGRDFAPSFMMTVVLLVGIAGGAAGSVAGAGLTARGMPGLRSWALILALAINVVLLLLLVPRWGGLGAALATAIGNIFASGAGIMWLQSRAGITISSLVGLRRDDLSALSRAGRRLMRRGENT